MKDKILPSYSTKIPVIQAHIDENPYLSSVVLKDGNAIPVSKLAVEADANEAHSYLLLRIPLKLVELV